MSALPVLTHDYILVGPKAEATPDGVSVAHFTLTEMQRHGDSVALVDAQSGQTSTYNGIHQEAVAVARALTERGISKGDVVGICSENRLEFAPAALAIAAVGATVAPLNPIYTVGELEHTMSISRPKMVFCSPFTFLKVQEAQEKMAFLQKIIVFGEVTTEEGFEAYNDLRHRPSSGGAFNCARVDPDTDVAVILCSSGTTGLPKCVELTHKNLLTVLRFLQDKRCTSISSKDVIMGLIPFFHGYGFGVLMMAMAIKMKMIVLSSFQEDTFLAAIQDYKVSYLFTVPPLCVFLAKHPLIDQFDLRSVKNIVCGAAPLSADVQDAVQRRLGVGAIRQGYGMTELSIACTVVPPDFTKVGSSGIPAPGLQCKIVDVTTGKALPPMKEGELCFKGPFVMKGYRNNPQATAEMVEPSGWLHTGDIGYYDKDGFLYIVDRLKELIKYKGFQVPPAELEALLLTNPAVKDAAVIGIPDDEAGELPLAFVVRQPDSNITAEEIKAFVAGKVSPQKRLYGGVRFLEAIPKNPSGKILRKDLRSIVKSKL